MLLKGNFFNETQLKSMKKDMIYALINLYKKVVKHDHLQVDNTASAIIKNNNWGYFMDTTRLIK